MSKITVQISFDMDTVEEEADTIYQKAKELLEQGKYTVEIEDEL